MCLCFVFCFLIWVPDETPQENVASSGPESRTRLKAPAASAPLASPEEFTPPTPTPTPTPTPVPAADAAVHAALVAILPESVSKRAKQVGNMKYHPTITFMETNNDLCLYKS